MKVKRIDANATDFDEKELDNEVLDKIWFI